MLPSDRERLIRFPDHTPCHQDSQNVHGTSDTQTAAIQDMCADHRRSHIHVSEKLLHPADVLSIFETMGAMTVTPLSFGLAIEPFPF